jgi:hypothetical protein
MSSPALVLFGAFIVIGTMAFTVGAIYLGGGSEAVRRQAPRLAMPAAGLVVLVLALPVLIGILGDQTWIVILLMLNAAVVAAWVHQSRRGEGPLVVERQRAAFRMPAFRALVIVWIGALAIGTILFILAAKAGY